MLKFMVNFIIAKIVSKAIVDFKIFSYKIVSYGTIKLRGQKNV